MHTYNEIDNLSLILPEGTPYNSLKDHSLYLVFENMQIINYNLTSNCRTHKSLSNFLSK